MFEFLKRKEKPVQEVQLKQGVDFAGAKINQIGLSDPYCPEIKSSYGFIYGERNLYPQQLLKAYSTSPIHQACINYKVLLTTGEGVYLDRTNLGLDKQIVAEQLIHFLNKSIDCIVNDFFIHNRFYLQITWNADFTKIIKIKPISAEKIRVFDINEDFEPISFNYCFDWKQVGRFGTKVYPIFNTDNKKDKIQLFEYQGPTPGKKIYTLPSYRSSLDWINLDGQMAIYHNANITNSLNPSLVVKFFQLPDTDQKKETIRQQLVDSFAGAEKTGRVMTFFAPDKESAPEVIQLEPNKLDKTFLGLTDTIQRAITYSHNVNPDLLGLKTPGSLGSNAGQLEEIRAQFIESVILPAKYKIEAELNYLSSINGITGIQLKSKI
jgi:hypothetical protein